MNKKFCKTLKLQALVGRPKPDFDFLPFIGLLFSLILSLGMSVFVFGSVISFIGDLKPVPIEVSFADRYGYETGVGTWIGASPSEVDESPPTDTESPQDTTQIISSISEEKTPIAWKPPCRGCGESRYEDHPVYVESEGFVWEHRMRHHEFY